ncbi:hypothetical protein A1O7_06985 [Cladophialophora yegresii CBS 114405]|uniref:Major facilitator superfamily (MFS) profile domain-containing protein n=1 Tax=Cladophialophora yegresii CBS 114405 TaxID=1182544 RepID=W9VWN4_9EURO|nr:uncharacterized protein A1O7_06985 [Cladophialophora yegresii CBS 114405]EXJ56641.1 hypothetical protein A1O7_06985 [Cladophialophora yegresii CBS 114405]
MEIQNGVPARCEPGTAPGAELDIEARIEALGRQRPEVFQTVWAEAAFCVTILASMLMAEYFVSGFNIILPFMATALDIPDQARTWPASVFSLVTGAFLLPLGRLADILGARLVFVMGLAWHFIWSLAAGFSQNYVTLIVCRALQGLGPAAYLPSGIMLLGRTYRPGPRKNLVFSLYGSFSPLGFFLGIFAGGASGQSLTWRWYFWIGAILLFLATVLAYMAVPTNHSDARNSNIKMDWWGASVVVPGLLLVVFALTDSSHTSDGWATPYVGITMAAGVICLGVAVYIEGWVAEHPLLPFDLFKVRHMKPLSVSLLLSYGVFGIYLFYTSL